MNKAFSLLELSIVLVIIGLIAGGIVAGASMIRAAELRALMTEKEQHLIAVNTFREKYLGLPGDLKNATAFWGDNATVCADAAITNGTPGTCNGNSDGRLNYAAGTSDTGEEFQFWNQLSLAGLVNGTFTGVAGPAAIDDLLEDENIPSSKFSGAQWRARYLGDLTIFATVTLTESHSSFFDIEYGNAIGITSTDTSLLLSPAELWNIDKKMDDGRPAKGNIIATPWNNNCTNASAQGDTDAEYSLTLNEPWCMVLIRHAF